MTPPVRRADDPPDFHGPDFRAEEPTFRIGYKEASVSVKGISVFVALGLLASIGATLYSGKQIEATIIRENARTAEAITLVTRKQDGDHSSLRIAQDRTSCILTMTQEYRGQFRARYQSGAFKQECPWIGE